MSSKCNNSNILRLYCMTLRLKKQSIAIHPFRGIAIYCRAHCQLVIFYLLGGRAGMSPRRTLPQIPHALRNMVLWPVTPLGTLHLARKRAREQPTCKKSPAGGNALKHTPIYPQWECHCRRLFKGRL